ncbi:MAG: Ribosome hibernation promotion factor [Bacteroidia bacterium]|jgi:putative sigma-54 modulation protein|nr:ribosome-associated translation inhibitor RaiA [Bacteroidia bacterium]CAI8192717.1 MAG: Ribosome hibernation promotion factor [Bacteroidia bacterium]
MNTQIQSIHFKADKKLIDFIERKLSKLETFHDGIIDAQVFLKLENTNVKENKTVEIKINIRQTSFIQTETSISYEAATDLAVDSLKTQIKRHKGKVETH